MPLSDLDWQRPCRRDIQQHLRLPSLKTTPSYDVYLVSIHQVQSAAERGRNGLPCRESCFLDSLRGAPHCIMGWSCGNRRSHRAHLPFTRFNCIPESEVLRLNSSEELSEVMTARCGSRLLPAVYINSQ